MKFKAMMYLSLASSLLLSTFAHAHYLWLEQHGNSVVLYFGELGPNLREVSPGRLDEMVEPSAMLYSARGERALDLTKTAKGYTADARLGKGESIVAEVARLPVAERKVSGKAVRTAVTRSARYISDYSAQVPKLTLDVVPTGRTEAGAVEFHVTFKNQPLSKAKVHVETVSGWTRELATDEQGKFSIVLPWNSTYVMEVDHNDATPGERAGEKYDLANYRTTLSVRQVKGLVSPPALSAAKSSK